MKNTKITSQIAFSKEHRFTFMTKVMFVKIDNLTNWKLGKIENL